MKKRATLWLILLIVLGVAATGCTPRRGSSNEVATDLHNYTAELQKWEPKEKAIFEAIDGVEESQYVDDDFVLRTLKGTLPTLDEHIREVAAYRPSTTELVSLHDQYRKGWEDLRGALNGMIAAESKKDYLSLAKGKAQMVAARALLLKAFAGMDALMEENDEALKNLRKS
jgi:hypothetical protein